MTSDELLRHVRDHRWHHRPTVEAVTAAECPDGRTVEVPTFVNEFWTSRQRAAHSLHEISYRACFKPQLPRFFIDRLTEPGAVVYDPFAGRGTTPLEAALAGRAPWACDINPLSRMLLEPRLAPPAIDDIGERLRAIDLDCRTSAPRDLEVFYHPATLNEVAALRHYLLDRERHGALDGVDRWIRMVTVNRLTGHSPGFLSVYTLPPNQA
ncbi:MAG TPA: DNA methyltransferase, partial [Vicinamibacterales bacterium]|nr:DNA methyltransferase [Vicinamibacterales bacterium]